MAVSPLREHCVS